MTWTPEDRARWTEGTVSEPWPGFELCYECRGSQLCDQDPHPYCSGWCHVCGGAGQWPLDPEATFYTPVAPTINLVYRAKVRERERR